VDSDINVENHPMQTAMRSPSSFTGGPLGFVAVGLLLGLTRAAGLGPWLVTRAHRPLAELRMEAPPYRLVPHTPPQPVDVLRVLDGDTFDARMRTAHGGEFVRVRLRDVDAAELEARCAAEYRKAIAARAALARILSEGAVQISDIGPDKYSERIDAHVSTRLTADVSAALLRTGLVRAYDGGRRRSWC
jgi:endonuclease YncB( thermonuclease family)